MTTSIVVPDDQYRILNRKINRIREQIVLAAGYHYELSGLDRALQNVYEGKFPDARPNEFENEELREHYLYPAGFHFRAAEKQLEFWVKKFPKLI